MKILTNRQFNEELAKVADKTSREIYDREELYRLNNRIEELERRVGCLEAEHNYRTPVNAPINPSWYYISPKLLYEHTGYIWKGEDALLTLECEEDKDGNK